MQKNAKNLMQQAWQAANLTFTLTMFTFWLAGVEKLNPSPKLFEKTASDKHADKENIRKTRKKKMVP